MQKNVAVFQEVPSSFSKKTKLFRILLRGMIYFIWQKKYLVFSGSIKITGCVLEHDVYNKR